ncbi:peptide-methionine (S)-S-oxide reductase [Flavobacterium sp.]|uniref:peptide-methionine (S)-S-oxide reductase n=1 Tax=Flavobacterium sp. TaxID=239 RepID=UPI0025C5A280|nr:peptide-methionine (S)-S-oxide reductase [Flavobacterium sp.]
MKTVGFGGGCHWCTEAVFSSLKGVSNVRQGWISSEFPNDAFSEAILFDFNLQEIDLETLIAIHLYTHSSTSDHTMRRKYRSAVYFPDSEIENSAKVALENLQPDFEKPLVTQVLALSDFRLNIEEQLNYYYSDRTRPFCEVYINPKLALLRQKFSRNIDFGKLGDLAV